MDLLYAGHFAGLFAWFRATAISPGSPRAIRESRSPAFCFGGENAGASFSACDRFYLYEVFIKKESDPAHPAQKPKPPKELRNDKNLLNLFNNAIEAASDEEGWAQLGEVGAISVKQRMILIAQLRVFKTQPARRAIGLL